MGIVLFITVSPNVFAACIVDEETGEILSPCRGLPVGGPWSAEYGKNIFTFGNSKVITFDDHVTDISLNWDASETGLLAKITFDKKLNDNITLHIPHDIPRLVNLDFGGTLYAVQNDGSWEEIKETRTRCFSTFEIPVKNSDSIEIDYATVAAGNMEIITIMDQACGDYSLKEQIDNNLSPSKINCNNPEHVLANRPNGKLACVYPETAAHLDWKFYTNIVLNENE